MIILTLKERQIIEDAVLRFGNDREREAWRVWKATHPKVRFDPDGQVDDNTGPIPMGFAEIVIAALDRRERALRAQMEQKMSEDETDDLMIDMAELHSTARAIRSAVSAN